MLQNLHVDRIRLLQQENLAKKNFNFTVDRRQLKQITDKDLKDL